MKQKPILSFIVPCYNEEETLKETTTLLTKKLEDLINSNKINETSYILFVDDGSKDNTWEILKNNSILKKIKALKLSKNYGHQYALLAGINFVEDKCDVLISLDADLQDDINAIDEMIEKFLQGYEIVYAARSNRDNDTFFKKSTAEIYYKLMKLIGVDLVFNHADYRLMSNKAINFFNSFHEINLFIRGIIPLLGLKSTIIYYERKKRFAGESKYSLRKMISFAFNGITSFSIMPLRVISFVGFLVFCMSLILGTYSLYAAIFTNSTIPGWASTVLPIYFIGGIQLLSLGIVGEYIGKIYIETKKRPRYFIEEIINE